jgi:uncharacterized membrane protein YccF (DUF307 family)
VINPTSICNESQCLHNRHSSRNGAGHSVELLWPAAEAGRASLALARGGLSACRGEICGNDRPNSRVSFLRQRSCAVLADGRRAADRVGIMPATSVLLNLLWIIFGGVEMAAGWLLAAVIMAITIIGLPWARAALTIAIYALLPFGHTVIDRPSGAIGGTLGFIGNLIWLVLAGWWLALGHLIAAIVLAVTIIGIPFAWAHLKLAGISLWPVGRDVISIEEARRASPW